MTHMQTSIPTWLMRGGTSRGPFFREADLPAEATLRDRVLLAAMGSPDARQIDGLGGAHPLTSKVGIVRSGHDPDVDLEFLFAQLQPALDTVDTTPNCGNMLAAVVPFALESGLLAARGETTTARVLTLNTGMRSDITVRTPGGRIVYEGEARIDGVPGTGAPIRIEFLDTAGSVCDSLLPTGQVVDRFEDVAGIASIEATCIDNGMPLVIFRAADVGCTGCESPAQLNADEVLKARVEALRQIAAERMGLGGVSAKNYPKMTLVADPSAGGTIATRSFIPHVCHEAIGVLAAVTVGTACVLPGSVANAVATLPGGSSGGSSGGEIAERPDGGPVSGSGDRPTPVSVEHPSGEFTVELALDPDDPTRVANAALLRTARLIMRGEVMVPGTLLETRA